MVVRFCVFVMLLGGMLLVYTPGVVAVTKTSMRQTVPGVIVPPVNVITFAPVIAVSTDVALQLVRDGAVELLIVIPEGRLSVMETLVSVVSAGALMSILNLELPPEKSMWEKTTSSRSHLSRWHRYQPVPWLQACLSHPDL